MVRKLVTLQPFGVASPGGGPRILRALLADPPTDVMSVCTSVEPPTETDLVQEVHAPPRRSAGRIDLTRLRPYVDLFVRAAPGGYIRRLRELIDDADAVHVVVHDGTFAPAVRAASGRKLFLSIHDDIEYADPMWIRAPGARKVLIDAWRGAAARFVVSEAIGEEYCRRLGRLPYEIITDGVVRTAPSPRVTGAERALYFAGLLHLSYEPNFLALFRALGGLEASIAIRCGGLPTVSLRKHAAALGERVTALPFAAEEVVARDIERADLLYLPLPFDRTHERLVRLSLSTKLVTYVGSGVPILYHGPSYGAAYDLLSGADAALLVTSPGVDALTKALSTSSERRREVAANALVLARESFLLEDQRRRFWDAVQANGVTR